MGSVTRRGGVSRSAAGAARVVLVAGSVGDDGGDGLGVPESEVAHGVEARVVERRGLLLDGELQGLQFDDQRHELLAQATLLAGPVGDQTRGLGRFGRAEQLVLLAVAEVAEVGGERLQPAFDRLAAVLQVAQALEAGGQQLCLGLERRNGADVSLGGGQFGTRFGQIATFAVHRTLAAQVQASDKHQAEHQCADHDVIEHDLGSHPLEAIVG